MSEDYIVIKEFTEPYDEYTEWKIVPKCTSPKDALKKSGFTPSTFSSDNNIVTIFSLGDNFTQTRYVGTPSRPASQLRTTLWKEV